MSTAAAVAATAAPTTTPPNGEFPPFCQEDINLCSNGEKDRPERKDDKNAAVTSDNDDDGNCPPSSPSSNARTVTLTVPERASYGDVLTFVIDGVEAEISVPEGSKPGDVLQIQVGVGGENDADEEERKRGTKEDENGVESVPLHPSLGILLRLRSSSDTEGAADAFGAGGASALAASDGTHSVGLWPTARLFCALLTSPSLYSALFFRGGNEVRRRRILELGSGTGACGLAVAAALSVQRDAGDGDGPGRRAEVILTDVPAAVPLLQANAEANAGAMGGAEVLTTPLVWGEELAPLGSKNEEDEEGSAFDLIIGSDLLYGMSSSYGPLAKTIESTLRPDGIVLLAVRWRQPDKERDFFRKMEGMGICFTLLQLYLEGVPRASKSFAKSERGADMDQGGGGDAAAPVTEKESVLETLPCILDWREYGNIESEEFVRYTVDTKVSVRRRTTFLVDLQEEDLEQMDDREHEEFEKTQTQFYVGYRCADGSAPRKEGGGEGGNEKKMSVHDSDACGNRKRKR